MNDDAFLSLTKEQQSLVLKYFPTMGMTSRGIWKVLDEIERLQRRVKLIEDHIAKTEAVYFFNGGHIDPNQKY